MEYLLDSNVLIDYLAGRFKDTALTELRAIVDKKLCIATIAKIELGFSSGNAEFDTKTEKFVSLAILYDLNSEVIDRTVKIRKSHKIKIADAIIAATAITNNFILLSRNIDDFKGIGGLKIINPYSLQF